MTQDQDAAPARCTVTVYAPALGTADQPERQRGLFACDLPKPCPVHLWTEAPVYAGRPIETARLAAAWLSDLPRLLRQERTRRGLSYRAAADEAGVDHVTWYAYENDQKDTTTAKATALLTWLAQSPHRATSQQADANDGAR